MKENMTIKICVNNETASMSIDRKIVALLGCHNVIHLAVMPDDGIILLSAEHIPSPYLTAKLPLAKVGENYSIQSDAAFSRRIAAEFGLSIGRACFILDGVEVVSSCGLHAAAVIVDKGAVEDGVSLTAMLSDMATITAYESSLGSLCH